MAVDQIQNEMADALERLEQDGTVPDDIYSSEEVFEREKERIFRRKWIPLGHESEIPDKGDYIVRYVLEESFILVRDEHGEVQVFANECCHQGRQVCHGEMGNASHFRCPYHGWTFDNTGDLIGIPHLEDAYQGNIDKNEIGGLRQPRSDTYDGLIFVCLSNETESLEEYLGDFKFYLDYHLSRAAEGMELLGPHRMIKDTNWKIGVINNMSDHYHTLITHRSFTDVPSILPTDRIEEDEPRYHIHAGPGGLEMAETGSWFEIYPEEMHESMREALPEENLELMEKKGYTPINGGFFPNFIINTTAVATPEDEDDAIGMTYVMMYRPLSPTQSEAYLWCAVEKNAPEKYKERAHQAFVGSFGSSGVADQDDAKNWMSVTEGSKGTSQDLRYNMQNETEPVDWEGPGTAYHSWFNEANARHFLQQYFEAMAGED